ncbi:glycoside hydrolase family 114 protein, partial [Piromyces sp. E2]
GQKAICYFSGGSSQKGKDDYKDYVNAGVVTDVPTGWGNRVLNIKKLDKLKPLIKNRFKRALKYQCDGVEVDSLSSPKSNDPDNYTITDVKNFAIMVAETAHEVGISVGLKNCPSIAESLEPKFDFAVVESCAEFNECKYFKKFTQNNKAVFIVHY